MIKNFQSPVIKEKSWDEKLLLRSTKVLGEDCLDNSIKISEKSEKFLIRGLLVSQHSIFQTLIIYFSL